MPTLTRAELRELVYDLLGTTSADKFYPTAKVDRWLDRAHSSLIQMIHLENPDLLVKVVTLQPDGGTGRVYSLATQATPVTDFSRVLELRDTDADGGAYQEAADEYLNASSGGWYSIVGVDEAVVLTLDASVTDSPALYLKYEYQPTFGALATATPTGIPGRFHELVALEAAANLFSLGGEGQMPVQQERRRMDLTSHLTMFVGRRSMSARRARDEGGEA